MQMLMLALLCCWLKLSGGLTLFFYPQVDSIPMDGLCMFDTMGACVVFYIKYNLG